MTHQASNPIAMRRRYKAPLMHVLILSLAFSTACNKEKASTPDPGWPEITREAKPWSRWWWMASAVDSANLTAALETYAAAGLGGLEVTPIYGVHGYEERSIPFLSPAWADHFEYTLGEAARLDLGIDLAMASGWPFGGPWVSPDEACRMMEMETWTLRKGERLPTRVVKTQEPLLRVITRKNLRIDQVKDPITANADSLQAWAIDQVRFPRPMSLQALMAYSNQGAILDLSPQVKADGTLDWTAPEGEWRVVALFEGWHGKLVERAGPGGEGDVIDHFSATAIDHYLHHFDTIFAGRDLTGLRAWFNDSYEVDDARGEADFTPLLLEEFNQRRGYDLRHHLPALMGLDSADINARVLTDYRQTISDLILENYTLRWHDWSTRGGHIIRNQAHGAPADILDLYAAADIPETEGEDIVKIKTASSVAHVTGKKLASSESATWLKDHFQASLEEVKHAADLFLLAGINHIFYHGTTYSPQEAPWPGWMFYAAVHFSPTNPFWKDFAALNGYIARVQSFLQKGTPDNDLLLYNPIFDEYADRGRSLLRHFDGSAQNSALRPVALDLWNRGYAFDYISDRQTAHLEVHDGSLLTGGNHYRALLVPPARLMPPETFEKLVTLARQGATILMAALPEDVPGWAHLDARRSRLQTLKEDLTFHPSGEGLLKATVGKGQIFTGAPDLLPAAAGLPRETMTELGLQTIRRKEGAVTTWFVVNRGKDPINQWIPLSLKGHSAVLYNPMNGHYGKARTESSPTGTRVHLRLYPGESALIQLFPSEVDLADYNYFTETGEKIPFSRPWTLTFTEGGPHLPPTVEMDQPGLWSTLEDEAYQAFSGSTLYSTSFPKPAGNAPFYRLCLGSVCHSATVTLNGRPLATLVAAPWQVDIPAAELNDNNTLGITVTNLMGNRIADMERKGIPYRIFYNVNFPASRPENRGPDGLFTTSGWAVQPSGLAGPVTLEPLNLP